MAVTRRGLLGAGAGTALGAAAGAGGVALVAHQDSGGDVVPFHGWHQAGILTPAQDRLHFATFASTSPRTSGTRSSTCCGAGPQLRP
jgi:deferrochelatase/peroxidase EfeB